MILSPLSRTWEFALSVVLTASFSLFSFFFQGNPPLRYRRHASDFFSAQVLQASCCTSSSPFLRHFLSLLPHIWCPFLLAVASTRRSGLAKNFFAIHDNVPLPSPHWSTLLLRLNRELSQQLQYQSHVAGPRGYQSPVCAAPRSVRTTRVFCRSSQVLRLTTPSINRPTFATLSRHATVSARVGRGCGSPTKKLSILSSHPRGPSNRRYPVTQIFVLEFQYRFQLPRLFPRVVQIIVTASTQVQHPSSECSVDATFVARALPTHLRPHPDRSRQKVKAASPITVPSASHVQHCANVLKLEPRFAVVTPMDLCPVARLRKSCVLSSASVNDESIHSSMSFHSEGRSLYLRFLCRV